jgi:hypothetical protein
MKLVSLSLVATVVLAGYSQAQTAQAPAQASAPAPAASTPADSSSSTGSQFLGHACREEVKRLCGRVVHGQELQDCIKSGLDLNKFSADCKAKLAQPDKPDG